MRVEVRQVLSDVAFFRDTISDIRFMKGVASWYTGFPSVADWTDGEVILKLNNYAHEAVVKRLAVYGIDAAVTCIDGARGDNAVKFSAKAGDDILFVLHKAMADQKLQTKVNKLENQMAGLNQNVDQLVEQLPHVQRGVFSRGVKAFKNQVDVLKNIRASQIKENQR